MNWSVQMRTIGQHFCHDIIHSPPAFQRHFGGICYHWINPFSMQLLIEAFTHRYVCIECAVSPSLFKCLACLYQHPRQWRPQLPDIVSMNEFCFYE